GVIAFIALILIDDYKTAVEWIMGVPTNGLGKVVLSMPIWFPLISSLSSTEENSIKETESDRMKKDFEKIDLFLTTNNSAYL
ncbi:hypothetical protein, partial [Thermodesulfatator atlanticus]